MSIAHVTIKGSLLPLAKTTRLILVALLAATAAQAQGVSLATLAFETDGLDLDTGLVTTSDMFSGNNGVDIRLAYNALRSPSAVVMPAIADGVDMSFVSGVPFDGVTADTAAGLAFSTDPVDIPFSANDTVLVRTDTGALFKLGNATESASGVTLNYSAL